jgi:hypothetical protein
MLAAARQAVDHSMLSVPSFSLNSNDELAAVCSSSDFVLAEAKDT